MSSSVRYSLAAVTLEAAERQKVKKIYQIATQEMHFHKLEMQQNFSAGAPAQTALRSLRCSPYLHSTPHPHDAEVDR